MEDKELSNDVVDVLAEGVDTALELAEGIPFIGQALKLAKLYRSVRDMLFVRQVQNFLRELNKAPQDEREAFIQDLRDRGQAQRFGETVTLLLAQLDNLDKSTIIGRLYAAAVLGMIEMHEAERVSIMVSRMYIEDRHILEGFKDEAYAEDSDTVPATLAAAGLLQVVQEQQTGFKIIGNVEHTKYRLSAFGDILVRFGLREAEPPSTN
ncbi:hypothetical protein [Rhizobium sp. L245/93]|uniref:hypothetical protein n=1 Tax=Rhizobium sp. L245/93 TaxID=2819998 RepID=UPI001ADC9AB5|nr:hypothetical protein [Rhizobium sp. L245/93]MBO9168361.1 hypothetical protein [Rhizobium sp. L245/93]